MLLESRRLGPPARNNIRRRNELKDIALLQVDRAIRALFLVHQQRKINAGLFDKFAGMLAIAQPHHRKACPQILKFCFVFTQLRDVQTAENSTVVAKKNERHHMLFPKRAQPNPVPIATGKHNVRQRATKRSSTHFLAIRMKFQSTRYAHKLAAIVIFALTYFVLAIGRFPGLRIDRTGAAIIGASLMVGVNALSLEDAHQAINFDTIILLFGMMIVVANLQLSGFFSLVAQRVVEHAASPVLLLIAIVAVAGFFSAFS